MSVISTAVKLSVHTPNWGWIGGISGIASIISFIQLWFPKWPILCSVVVFGVLLILVWLLIFLFFLIREVGRWLHNRYVDSIWGKTIVDLAEVYASIHQLERKNNVAENDIAIFLSNFCDAIKNIFDRNTKTNCCVSIKVPISNFSENGKWESMEFRNIARDQSHISERDTTDYKEARHTVIGNTAYSRIIDLVIRQSSKTKFYLNNSVKDDDNYATTSPICHYRSELVVPILPSRYDDLSEIKFGGFLCIDSTKRNAFDKERYDVPMTQGLADGLYSLIQKLIEKKVITTK